MSHITYIIAHSIEKVKGVIGFAQFSVPLSSPTIEVPAYVGLVQNLHQVFHQLRRYIRVFAVNLGVQLKSKIVMQLLYGDAHNLVGDGNIEQEARQLLVLPFVEAFSSVVWSSYLNIL